MLFELSIVPVGCEHMSKPIAESIKVIEASGCPYKVTPTSTCIEGEWDEILPIIRKCHEVACQYSSHVITSIKIEDDGHELNMMQRNVESVEQAVGHAVSH